MAGGRPQAQGQVGPQFQGQQQQGQQQAQQQQQHPHAHNVRRRHVYVCKCGKGLFAYAVVFGQRPGLIGFVDFSYSSFNACSG